MGLKVNFGIGTTQAGIPIKKPVLSQAVPVKMQADSMTKTLAKNYDFRANVSIYNDERVIKGIVDGQHFELAGSQTKKYLLLLNGFVGDKKVRISSENNLAKNQKFKGQIGDKNFDVSYVSEQNKFKIKGKYGDKNIEFLYKRGLFTSYFSDDSSKIAFSKSTLFGNDINAKGSFSQDSELVPVLIAIMKNIEVDTMKRSATRFYNRQEGY